MTVRQMQKVLEADDFADTRTWDLAHAAEVLHRACCPLDSWNLEMFTKRYGGSLGIFKFMEDYSGTENGTRDIDPVPVACGRRGCTAPQCLAQELADLDKEIADLDIDTATLALEKENADLETEIADLRLKL